MAGLHQPVEDRQQFLDVVQVQTGRGLIQDVEDTLSGAATVERGQLGGDLESLGFASGERGRRLPQAQIAQTHGCQHMELCAKW